MEIILIFFNALLVVTTVLTSVSAFTPTPLAFTSHRRASSLMMSTETQTGTVKWYDPAKGFGFIVMKESGDDIFVHNSNILMDGFRSLDEGETVSFEVGHNDKGLSAENVQVIEVDPDDDKEEVWVLDDAAMDAAEAKEEAQAEKAAQAAAAEEASKKEAEEKEAARIAAEENAAKLKAEEEARIAAEEEAVRKQAEEEAAKLKEEEARIAAEAEAARVKAQEEAAAAQAAAEEEARNQLLAPVNEKQRADQAKKYDGMDTNEQAFSILSDLGLYTAE